MRYFNYCGKGFFLLIIIAIIMYICKISEFLQYLHFNTENIFTNILFEYDNYQTNITEISIDINIIFLRIFIATNIFALFYYLYDVIEEKYEINHLYNAYLNKN